MTNVQELGKAYDEFIDIIDKKLTMDGNPNSQSGRGLMNVSEYQRNRDALDKFRRGYIEIISNHAEKSASEISGSSHLGKAYEAGDKYDYFSTNVRDDLEKLSNGLQPKLGQFDGGGPALKFNGSSYETFFDVMEKYRSFDESLIGYLSQNTDPKELKSLSNIPRQLQSGIGDLMTRINQGFELTEVTKQNINEVDVRKLRSEVVSKIVRPNEAQRYILDQQDLTQRVGSYGNQFTDVTIPTRPISKLPRLFDTNQHVSRTDPALDKKRENTEKIIGAKLLYAIGETSARDFEEPVNIQNSDLKDLVKGYGSFTKSIDELQAKHFRAESDEAMKLDWRKTFVRSISSHMINTENSTSDQFIKRLSLNAVQRDMFSHMLDKHDSVEAIPTHEEIVKVATAHKKFAKQLSNYVATTLDPIQIKTVGTTIPESLRQSVSNAVTELNVYFGSDVASRKKWADTHLDKSPGQVDLVRKLQTKQNGEQTKNAKVLEEVSNSIIEDALSPAHQLRNLLHKSVNQRVQVGRIEFDSDSESDSSIEPPAKRHKKSSSNAISTDESPVRPEREFPDRSRERSRLHGR